ncbi:MAG: hypothetical protein H6740_08305 [Alphaproteobacteria bacterium]|nr:hypothetical protein [Alphaproteobacteria bacterium]
MLLLLLACASTPPLLTEPAAAEALRGLLTPLPRVYEQPPDRDAVHDFLAASLYGEALTREYVEAWTTLTRMQAEGSALAIEAVELDHVQRLGVSPLRVEARWTVTGTVTHRGHAHRRANRYRAVFTLAETPEGLRIVEARARDHERLAVPEAVDEARPLWEMQE